MLHAPSFLFAASARNGYAVVRAEGELDIAAVPSMRAEARRATCRSPRVVIDLRAVVFMDTWALAALIALSSESSLFDWTLHVIPGHGVQHVLDLAGARDALRWISPEQLAG